ncbi:hypothetical protein CPB86DRAFT_814022 [Serendipita vermifera]|nr:hypothetical protein CPB86DRAFT_814022 [Serendipita vermifera]
MIAALHCSTSPGGTSKGVKRKSTFKIVPKHEPMLLPEASHERRWIHKQGDKEDLAADGKGWKSSAFSIVPGSTPTTTQHAPAATVVDDPGNGNNDYTP